MNVRESDGFWSFCLLIFLLCFARETSCQGFLKANGKQIVNEKGGKVILRGMGLGGWMLQEGYMLQLENIANQQWYIREKIQELIGPERTSEFYEAWLANHLRKIDVDSMAAWGFNSIRLPLHYNLFTLPVEQEAVPGQQTWLTKGFALTDSLLTWCKANKMYLILDLHAAPGGQGNDLAIADRDDSKPSLWQSDANQQKTIALWRKLAERYASEPWLGAYDIINEPNWGFESKEDDHGCGEQKNEPLKKLMMSITQVIREVDKNHIIIVEGNCWGNNYGGMLPLWDKNMVMSFHKYWNYNDKASIQKYLDLREKYDVPVWLGESGENSNVWFRDAIRLMEDHDIGWCWWPLKKLGFNNPLEVKLPTGYQGILDFWEGKGTKPSGDQAYRTFMELAENTKLENCIFHQDVVDAMFRQVRSSKAMPFAKHLVEAQAVIQAVNYDLGGNGVAYFDRDTADFHISSGSDWTAWNYGHVYRNDGVDIERTTGSDANEYYVTRFESGEWLQYSFFVEQKGVYVLKIAVSSELSTGKILLASGSFSVTKPVPNTGAPDAWETIEVPDLHLDQGNQILKVTAKIGGFNFKSFELYRK